MPPILRLAIDGNEANTSERVGSNVYAGEILRAMADLVGERGIQATVLLARPPLDHLPPASEHWRYQLVGPERYWTQWAAPLFLEQHRSDFDIFFTPGHYAPRHCPIPYLSSVMDTAYLAYPSEFKLRDRIQLTDWTAYSVKHASRVVTISRFTKRCVCEAYQRAEKDVIVAYPAVAPMGKVSAPVRRQWLVEHQLTQPYFLYVGTIQPRKRLSYVIEAFEQTCADLIAAQSKYRAKRKQSEPLPQLVLAGKIGWLAAPIVQRATQSPYSAQIKLLGYVTDQEKTMLLQGAQALILIGRHEGFGIPPLEAMHAGTIPIVARTGSLPEVVGPAGLLVAADDSLQLTNKLKLVLEQSARERGVWLAKGREQAKLFSWRTSATIILEAIESVYAQQQPAC